MACVPIDSVIDLAPRDTASLLRVLHADELAAFPPGKYGINIASFIVENVSVPPEVEQALGVYVNAFLFTPHLVFAPIFFATAGMYVDLAAVTTGTGLLWAIIIVAVASFTKLTGSYAGARLSHMPHSEGIAIGVGGSPVRM